MIQIGGNNMDFYKQKLNRKDRCMLYLIVFVIIMNGGAVAMLTLKNRIDFLDVLLLTISLASITMTLINQINFIIRRSVNNAITGLLGELEKLHKGNSQKGHK